MNSKQLKQMRRHRYAFRFMGAMFTMVGGLLLLSFVPLLLDPTATMLVNGVESNDPTAKLSAVLFLSGFLGLGVFFLLGPSSFFNRLFLWRQAFWYALFPSR